MATPTYEQFLKIEGPLEDAAWRDRQGHDPNPEQVRHTAYRRLIERWEAPDIRNELRGLPHTPGPGPAPQPSLPAFFWRGVTDFRLPQLQMAGHDIRPLLNQRKACGCDLVRVLGMKFNNTGWELNPDGRPHYFTADLPRFFDALAAHQMRCEWNVFADTRHLPGWADSNKQSDFWQRTIEALRPYAAFVFLSRGNEVTNRNHQSLDFARLAKPSGLVSCAGSSQEDETPVKPLWDYATYGARRKKHPADGRAATTYSPFAFEEDYPKPVPVLASEGEKPENYGFDTTFARLMGQHARTGHGGVFHTDHGINGILFQPDVEACARAFVEGLSR